MEYQAVAEGSRRWNELVSEWQQLDEQEEQATTGIQWRRGDILLEVEPPGPNGVKTGSYERLRRFGEEVGRDWNSLRTYRDTAAAWAAASRLAAASFSVHAELRYHPDRFNLIQPGMTRTAARIAAGKLPDRGTPSELLSEEHRQQRASDAVRDLTPENRAAVARQMLEDPAVAEQVIADPHTDATITRARMRRDDERETTVRDRAHQEAPGLIHHSRIYGSLVDMDAAERRLADALTQIQEINLDDSDRAKITERNDAVRRMNDAITAHVTSGQRFDDELAQLIERGE